MSTYVLVGSPFEGEWYLVKEDWWYSIAGERQPVARTLVRETCEAEAWHHLDWSKCGFGIYSGSNYGWLDRDGHFVGGRPCDHDRLALAILGKPVSELERTGWCRVYADRFFCATRPSPDQRNWLSSRGHDPDKN